jgi:pilus assembly protein CpaB
MNRNTRTILVLILAVAVAGVASYGVYLAVRAMPRTQVPQARVVVAARAISVGTMVGPKDVKLVAWPADSVVPGSLTTVEQVVNRGLLDSVAQNEPLTESKLAKPGDGAGLSPTIPPGMRAISLKVNEVIGVAGFVVPGTHVDVLVSINQGDGRESVARVVVSNVLVLTAGTRFDQERARKDAKPIPTSVVTLVVSPEDAERLTLAADEGKIMLTLRNPGDQEQTKSAGVGKGSLFAGSAPPAAEKPAGAVVPVARRTPRPAPPPPVAPQPVYRPYTVETIRAAKRSEEPVR